MEIAAMGAPLKKRVGSKILTPQVVRGDIKCELGK